LAGGTTGDAMKPIHDLTEEERAAKLGGRPLRFTGIIQLTTIPPPDLMARFDAIFNVRPPNPGGRRR
jgi:hypothetical protein